MSLDEFKRQVQNQFTVVLSWDEVRALQKLYGEPGRPCAHAYIANPVEVTYAYKCCIRTLSYIGTEILLSGIKTEISKPHSDVLLKERRVRSSPPWMQ